MQQVPVFAPLLMTRQAFDFALSDKEISRRLPCKDELFAANKPVETRIFRSTERQRYAAPNGNPHGHFSHFVEILGILSSIHEFLKRPIDIGSLSDVENWQGTYRALDTELNAWHFSQPDEFANITRMAKSNTPSKGANSGWITVHAAYVSALSPTALKRALMIPVLYSDTTQFISSIPQSDVASFLLIIQCHAALPLRCRFDEAACSFRPDKWTHRETWPTFRILCLGLCSSHSCAWINDGPRG